MFSLVAPVKRGKAIHMWFFSLPTSPYWQPSPSICHPHLPALYLSLLVSPISFVVFPCPMARLFLFPDSAFFQTVCVMPYQE